jgi:hypothetical protein
MQLIWLVKSKNFRYAAEQSTVNVLANSKTFRCAAEQNTVNLTCKVRELSGTAEQSTVNFELLLCRKIPKFYAAQTVLVSFVGEFQNTVNLRCFRNWRFKVPVIMFLSIHVNSFQWTCRNLVNRYKPGFFTFEKFHKTWFIDTWTHEMNKTWIFDRFMFSFRF